MDLYCNSRMVLPVFVPRFVLGEMTCQLCKHIWLFKNVLLLIVILSLCGVRLHCLSHVDQFYIQHVVCVTFCGSMECI